MTLSQILYPVSSTGFVLGRAILSWRRLTPADNSVGKRDEMRAKQAGGIYRHDSVSASDVQVSPLYEHGAETKRDEGTWPE